MKKIFHSIVAICSLFLIFFFCQKVFGGSITPTGPGFTSNANGQVPPELVQIDGAKPIGKQACFACHPAQGPTPFKPNGEIGLTPDEWDMEVHQKVKGTFECESCHGNGSLHQKANAASFITNPGRLSKEKQNALCQSCHLQGVVAFHGGADLSCLDCHQFHTVKNPMLLKKLPEREICYQCHAQQKMEFNMYSHHPVNEGIMSCTDCHEPHFSSEMDALKGGPELLGGDRRSTEACARCHPREAGPYASSPAALEGCTGCHVPHGSFVEKLESMQEPALCIRCHEPTMFEFETLAPRCTICHPNIHGSNHARSLVM